MKLFTGFLVVLSFVTFTRAIGAGEGNAKQGGFKGGKQPFVSDGDEKLNPAKKGAVKAALGGTDAGGFTSKAKPEKESKAGLQKKVIEQFDLNGNGTLEPDEQAAARKAAAERRKNKKKAGQDGAGQSPKSGNGLDEPIGQPMGAGGAGPTGHGQAKLLQKFDLNRDGMLSPDEVAKAQEWMRRNAGPGQGAGQLPLEAGRPPRPQAKRP